MPMHGKYNVLSTKCSVLRGWEVPKYNKDARRDCPVNQSPVSLFWHNLTNVYSPNGNSKSTQNLMVYLIGSLQCDSIRSSSTVLYTYNLLLELYCCWLKSFTIHKEVSLQTWEKRISAIPPSPPILFGSAPDPWVIFVSNLQMCRRNYERRI